MRKNMDEIEVLFNLNKIEEAEKQLEILIKNNTDHDGAHFFLGKVLCKKQEWGKAINEFRRALEINPENKEAQLQLDMVNSILGYYTPDMFNP